MPERWPGLVLIDGDNMPHVQLAATARALGVGVRRVAAIPQDPDSTRDKVRVVICALAATRGLVTRLRAAFPAARAIIYGRDASQRAAVDAFRAGADDFVAAGSGASELRALLASHFPAPPAQPAHQGLVGNSAKLRAVRDYALRLSPTNVSVLISGETGTGKECLAAIVHRNSKRASGPLVALNCAAIPDGLLEGELFGYERGAFSGAHASYPGKLKLADGGTLLLDEIGELSLAGQAKVLRAIETGEAYRLGATKPTRFDVRIVAATNRDLMAEIAAGRFREDLFYRLAVARLEVPALRARPEDIAPIATHLLDDLAAASGLAPARLDDAAMRMLTGHCWPGNVRELRNVIEIAMVTCRGSHIGASDLPAYLSARSIDNAMPADERGRLVRALAHAGGNKSEAAKALNCSRMTLYRRLERLGVAAPMVSQL